jgi:hypothetical protein
LIEMIALLEAGIDFAEDDISVAPAEEILRRLSGVRSQVDRMASSYALANPTSEKAASLTACWNRIALLSRKFPEPLATLYRRRYPSTGSLSG